MRRIGTVVLSGSCQGTALRTIVECNFVPVVVEYPLTGSLYKRAQSRSR